MKSFGIGCWSFEPVGARSGDAQALRLTRDGTAFAAAIVQTLEMVPTVKNVAVSPLAIFPYDNDDEPEVLYESSPSVLTAKRFLPHPIRGRIEFDLEVPAVAFKRLRPFYKSATDLTFHIQIRYTEHFPVTYVIGTGTTDVGSQGVYLAREFLLDELKRRESKVVLRILGPSPFWADANVLVAEPGVVKDKTGWEVSWLPVRGSYDVVYFLVAPDQGFSEEDALEYVCNSVEPEFAIYYQMASRKQRLFSRWIDIKDQIDRLVKLHEKTGFSGYWGRTFKSGKLSRQLSLRVLQVENEAVAEDRRGAEEIAQAYQSAPLEAFKKQVEAEMRSEAGAVPGARDIVTLLETRQAQTLSLIIVLASSAIGGLAGAVVTAVLT
jgi:hypothetical protein